jgi:metallo-beta-lactamase class B
MRETLALGAALFACTALCGARGEQDHIAAALRLSDMREAGFIQVCGATDSPRIPKGISQGDLIAAPLPPAGKAFDNLYFVGSRWTNAWAITTSQGIILLDAMDNDWEAEHVIADGLEKLGLDPAQIRYVIVSHGHSDHYGGANWLKAKYGARIVMSAIDWDLVDKARGKPAKDGRGDVPARDMTVKDGDAIVLGDTKLRIHLTPGHTLGTISSVFDVRQHGKLHHAMLWGGSSFNFGRGRPDQLQAYLETVRVAPAWIKRERIDVLLSNHPEYDRSIVKLAALQGGKSRANPFVIGVSGVIRAVRVIEQCALATQIAWAKSGNE